MATVMPREHSEDPAEGPKGSGSTRKPASNRSGEAAGFARLEHVQSTERLGARYDLEIVEGRPGFICD